MPFLATLNPFQSFATADQAQQGLAATRAACVLLAMIFGALSLARVWEHGLAWPMLSFGAGMFSFAVLLWAAMAHRRLQEGSAAIAMGLASLITAGGVASLMAKPSLAAALPAVALLWAAHGYRAVRALGRFEARPAEA